MHWREIRNEKIIWVLIGNAFVCLCVACIAIEVSSSETAELPSFIGKTILSREQQVAILGTCYEDADRCEKYFGVMSRGSRTRRLRVALAFFQYRTNPTNFKKFP